FRIRTTEKRGNWLGVTLTASGQWLVFRNDLDEVNGKRTDKITMLKESSVDDRELAAGKWVNVAARCVGNEYEVWINGKSVARGIDTPSEVGADVFQNAI